MRLAQFVETAFAPGEIYDRAMANIMDNIKAWTYCTAWETKRGREARQEAAEVMVPMIMVPTEHPVRRA